MIYRAAAENLQRNGRRVVRQAERLAERGETQIGEGLYHVQSTAQGRFGRNGQMDDTEEVRSSARDSASAG